MDTPPENFDGCAGGVPWQKDRQHQNQERPSADMNRSSEPPDRGGWIILFAFIAALVAGVILVCVGRVSSGDATAMIMGAGTILGGANVARRR
ncbi:hypothetical protein [Embleya hyalina]|uniref:hypothetical protein n=1 Tax=Embleya hyalina TaxID=516124 RepID=UPI000F830F06|nr:hypothetical protein [Embleya hyalina]